MSREGSADADVTEMLLGNKNNLHNNYQDFQAQVQALGQTQTALVNAVTILAERRIYPQRWGIHQTWD